jgi:hypothetical protein
MSSHSLAERSRRPDGHTVLICNLYKGRENAYLAGFNTFSVLPIEGPRTGLRKQCKSEQRRALEDLFQIAFALFIVHAWIGIRLEYVLQVSGGGTNADIAIVG